MKLFEVAARRFSVRVVYNEDGSCQVMEKMRRVRVEHQELVYQMGAFQKTGTTPPDQVRLALRERARYYRDKTLNNLDLVDWRPGGKEHG